MSIVLEQAILASLGNAKKSNTGFYQVKCPVCGDTQVRAGWKFEPNAIIYNCFRGKCDASIVYEHDGYISKKFRRVLDAFHVPIPVELLVNNKKTKFEELLDADLYEAHTYNTIKLPEDFEPYDPDEHKAFRNHLKMKRNLTDTDYYIGNEGQWKNRLIVPFYSGSRLIGWQGLDTRPNIKPKYLSSGSDLIYMPLGYIPDEPFVFEGVFDAKVVPNGVATLQSGITKKQAFMLKDKNPILVPDRKDSRYLDAAKKYGWRVCIPKFNTKDACDSSIEYGRLATTRMLVEGITNSTFEAEVNYKIWTMKKSSKK